jgi:hypothetical protein
MFTYDQWLNEAASPKKAALYKKGDKVIVSSSDISIYDGSQFKKAVGVFYGEITSVEISSGKWIYFVKIIAGSATLINSRVRRVYYEGAVAKCPEKLLSTEKVKEFEEIYKDRFFNKKDSVSFIYRNLNKTGTIVGIDLSSTLKDKEIHYFIEPNEYMGGAVTVPQKDVQEDEELDKFKEDTLAEEIAKALDVKIKNYGSDEQYNRSIEYDVIGYSFSEIKGTLFFRDKESFNRFIKEIKETVEKYEDPKLQLVMDEGAPSEINVGTSTSWKGGTIEVSKLKDAAKNLKIDIKGVFTKLRGKLTGKKFGV